MSNKTSTVQLKS